jgi:hypothetical protein
MPHIAIAAQLLRHARAARADEADERLADHPDPSPSRDQSTRHDRAERGCSGRAS